MGDRDGFREGFIEGYRLVVGAGAPMPGIPGQPGTPAGKTPYQVGLVEGMKAASANPGSLVAGLKKKR